MTILLVRSTKVIGQVTPSLCSPPSKQFIQDEITRITRTDPSRVIWYPNALRQFEKETVIIKGSFSAKGQQEYLVVLKSQFYAGMMSQIDRFDLLLKISCVPNNSNAWQVDWYNQTKAVSKNNVKDIDGDGIDELIIQGGGIKLGILRGFYEIISLKGNKDRVLYQNRSLSYGGTGPTIVNYLPRLDTLSIQHQLQFKDVNNDHINEIVEQTEVMVYTEGKAYKTIMKNALKLKQTRVLYLTKGKYTEHSRDQIIRKAKQYYQFLNQRYYGQIKRLFVNQVQQWLSLKNISKEKVGLETTRFLSTKKNVQYQPDFTQAHINGNTLKVPVKLGWNDYKAEVMAHFTFNTDFKITHLLERSQ